MKTALVVMGLLLSTHGYSAGVDKKMVAEEHQKAIQYDGYCATGLAFGKKIESDPKVVSVVGGKAYFFSNAGAKEVFDKDVTGTLSKADKYWSKIKQ